MAGINKVYVLWHSHELPGERDDDKLIGVYRTEADAEGAIERLRDKPGFRHFPDLFMIGAYELNRHQWTNGFVTKFVEPDGTMVLWRTSCRKIGSSGS